MLIMVSTALDFICGCVDGDSGMPNSVSAITRHDVGKVLCPDSGVVRPAATAMFLCSSPASFNNVKALVMPGWACVSPVLAMVMALRSILGFFAIYKMAGQSSIAMSVSMMMGCFIGFGVAYAKVANKMVIVNACLSSCTILFPLWRGPWPFVQAFRAGGFV